MSPEPLDTPAVADYVDSFFVKIAADFIRHRPEKLESILFGVYQAGYQAGLWDAVDNIRSMPGWDEVDES